MIRKSAIRVCCIIGSMVLFSFDSNAFEYDVWQSGISISQALKIAESLDIPLTKTDTQTPNMRRQAHFDASVTKEAKATGSLCYKDILMDKAALVTLSFTPVSRKLCKLSVYWLKSDVFHEKEVIAMLERSCGAPKGKAAIQDSLPPVKEFWQKHGLVTLQYYVIDAQNIISVRLPKLENDPSILNYHDIPLINDGLAEENNLNEYLKIRYQQQDRRTF